MASMTISPVLKITETKLFISTPQQLSIGMPIVTFFFIIDPMTILQL